MEMVPSSFLVSAGHPGFKHIPHFLHFSGIGLHFVVNLFPFNNTQGDFVIITDTSSFAVSSFTILSNSAVSKALTSTTFLMPIALHK